MRSTKACGKPRTSSKIGRRTLNELVTLAASDFHLGSLLDRWTTPPTRPRQFPGLLLTRRTSWEGETVDAAEPDDAFLAAERDGRLSYWIEAIPWIADEQLVLVLPNDSA